jgi:hypothetical protein
LVESHIACRRPFPPPPAPRYTSPAPVLTSVIAQPASRMRFLSKSILARP